MPAPSQLAIATSSLNRLVKEEASYHKEYEQQKANITKLEQSNSSDENAEYTLKQERKALEETQAIFPSLQQKIQEAKARLETLLTQSEQNSGSASADDISKAKEAVAASNSK